ncbi:MAG: hypothetical protein AB1758_19250 [Candidatus Eremiobacterota bacterium]
MMGPNTDMRFSSMVSAASGTHRDLPETGDTTQAEPVDQVGQGREQPAASGTGRFKKSLEMYGRMARYTGFLSGWNALGAFPTAFSLGTIRSNSDTGVFAVHSPFTLMAPSTIYSLPGNTEVVDRTSAIPSAMTLHYARNVTASQIQTTVEDGKVNETRVKLEARVGSSPNTLEVVNPDGSITVLDTKDLTFEQRPPQS